MRCCGATIWSTRLRSDSHELTAGLSGALLLGYITQRLGLSPIVGYLLAGTLVGPNTPGVTVDLSIAEQLAEVGVILLMFGVGLQFHLAERLAVRGVAIPGALIQCTVSTALGIAVGSARIFGVSMALGAFLAGMVVGRSDYSLRAASDALPMRDAFAVLFFVSVGMLLDPASLLDSPALFAGTLAIVLVMSPAATFAAAWMPSTAMPRGPKRW
jgi:CPA2 family monovalent cation:H+ antiporter-2